MTAASLLVTGSYAAASVKFQQGVNYAATIRQANASDKLMGSVWIKPTVAFSALGFPIFAVGSAGAYFGWSVMGAGGVRVEYDDPLSSGQVIDTANGLITLNQWNHIFFLFNDNDCIVFVNTVEVYFNQSLPKFAAQGGIADAWFKASSLIAGATGEYEGEVADFFLTGHTEEPLDWHNDNSKIQAFIRNNAPVNLGFNGFRPTGTQAKTFFSGAASEWTANKGSLAGTTNGNLINGNGNVRLP